MENSLLNEVASFVQKLAADDFMKFLSMKDQRIAQIENYHRRIEAAVASFQVRLDQRWVFDAVARNPLLSHIDFRPRKHSGLAAAK